MTGGDATAGTTEGAVERGSDAAVARALCADAVRGLAGRPKTLPSKYFYDAIGSALFERICTLDAYYPTRVEIAILERHLPEMATLVGRGARVVEFGTGSGIKTRLLLERLQDPVAYIPVEIARGQIEQAATELTRRFPAIEVLPVCADYTGPIELPPSRRAGARTLVFFPGSTIGNFHPEDAGTFLGGAARVAGPGGLLLIGIDLRKERAILERAYDDPEGVTAAFNRNILTRLNRECGADFNPHRFRHHAPWNERDGRIEMHLVSLADQEVHLPAGDGGVLTIAFAAEEPIVTEYSYKYTIPAFERIADRAGFEMVQAWTDEREWFAELLFAVR